MKIKFLGTAAAEAVPAFFCECETCKKARLNGGKEIRTRTQALIDNRLMIDFPPDTYFHSITNNIELVKIRNYLITHTHSDHFCPDEIEFFGKGFAKIFEENPTFNFYGGAEMVKKGSYRAKNTDGRVALCELAPFKSYEIDGFTVTPLKANHGTETPYIYIIEADGKRILYAHDTGLFTEETERYLYENKLYFNLISFDCCFGSFPDQNYGGHMCFAQNVLIAEKMKSYGMVDDKTVLVANHFSHNSPDILYENRAVYEEKGFVMAYDGLEIEI